jgi:hypothetical protein
MWDWYQAGGVENVAAYLTQLDLSDFNSKAPPAKTAAFLEIVHASSAPEDAEVADVLDRLGNPAVVTLSQLIKCTQNDPANLGEFGQWLSDRRNRRTIPHRLEACGYCAVQNGSRDDGLWTIYGKRQVIYGKTDLAERDRQTAAAAMVGR